MSRYWNPIVKTLTPYIPGEQPKDSNHSIKAKLNTNENPYPPSPKALDAMQVAIREGLELYPDTESTLIKEAVANMHGISAQEVFVGNGSDEVLAHIFHGLFNPAKPVLFPDISYSFYPVYANLYQLDVIKIPLRDDFSIQIHDYDRDNGGIIFPNPNAPTGKYLPLSAIEELLMKNTHSVVVIDEAYIDFGGESAACLIKKYDQLLVTQTLSKSRSLAGLRVGFAIGNPDLIEGLNRVKNSFNSFPIDRIALAGAAASIADIAYFNQTREKIIASRVYLTLALERLGFDVIPSSANFVMAKPPAIEAKTLHQQLKDQGVLVRYFDTHRIDGYLRMTVGSQVECELLISEIKQILRTT